VAPRGAVVVDQDRAPELEGAAFERHRLHHRPLAGPDQHDSRHRRFFARALVALMLIDRRVERLQGQTDSRLHRWARRSNRPPGLAERRRTHYQDKSPMRNKAMAEQPALEDERELGDALEFLQLLWSIDHALQSMSKRMVANLGVTGPQRLVIRLIGRFPNILAGELSELLRLHPSTLTGILQRLEERSLITRRRDREDLRRAHFSLTAKGKKLDALQSGTVEAAIRRVLGKLPEQKIDAAKKALLAISDELNA
jgi:MarR family transcriptional regulator, organic hydroperoxide resistance regulator